MGVPLAWLLNAKPLQYYEFDARQRDYTNTMAQASHNTDVLLIDMDVDLYRNLIDQFNGDVIIYPHGANPIMTWDGEKEPHPKVKLNLVTSEGHKEVMRRYGYPKPIEVVGWYLCEIEPWKPVKGNKVLFCPIHPIGGGLFMYDEDSFENARVYNELLDMNIELAVRYRHALVMNGLHKEDGVRYYSTGWFDDLDEYDMVVANGTLAYAAIAKGIPTVMVKQDTCIRNLGDAVNNSVEAKSVDKYWDYLKYPYSSEDLEAGMRQASRHEPVEWKKRFIGEQMDGEKFVKIVSQTGTQEG